MTRTLKVLLTVICLSFTAVLFAADKDTKVTYRWKDDNGIIQYTERPPKNRAYEMIKVKTGGSREVTQVSQEEAVQASQDEAQTELDELAKANERNCKVSKQNLAVLQNLSRIRVTENGEERILSPEEKQEKINETQKQIDIYCKPL